MNPPSGGFFRAAYAGRSPGILRVEVIVMSPKELLYIEDALGHEKFLISQCRQALSSLTDPQLRDCVQQMQHSHQQIFNQLYQLV